MAAWATGGSPAPPGTMAAQMLSATKTKHPAPIALSSMQLVLSLSVVRTMSRPCTFQKMHGHWYRELEIAWSTAGGHP
jgi:hypothetical protein